MADSQPEGPQGDSEFDSRRFGRAWAKIEIFLGLTAAGGGLLYGDWLLARSAVEIDWGLAAGALALFVLGGYLALAGHRSHLYRSNIESAVRLMEEIRRLRDKG